MFRTRLGWMALLGRGSAVLQLTFGQGSARAAIAALDPRLLKTAQRLPWNPRLIRRLRAYASGKPVQFDDVAIDPGPLTPFQRRVIACCRAIPWGTTLTYGQLAAKAGFPGAARAVGNCMAANRLPLIVPCHRVVGADGRLRGYSGPGGQGMKRRLLQLEEGRRP
ncbi:MAG: methylated-DNA--[protein]-cysteine S-methyltransferase [Thermoguttaceae bacterium]